MVMRLSRRVLLLCPLDVAELAASARLCTLRVVSPLLSYVGFSLGLFQNKQTFKKYAKMKIQTKTAVWGLLIWRDVFHLDYASFSLFVVPVFVLFKLAGWLTRTIHDILSLRAKVCR